MAKSESPARARIIKARQGTRKDVAMAITTIDDNMAVIHVPTATIHDDGSLAKPTDHDRPQLDIPTDNHVEYTAPGPDTAIVHSHLTDKGQDRQGRKRSQG